MGLDSGDPRGRGEMGFLEAGDVVDLMRGYGGGTWSSFLKSGLVVTCGFEERYDICTFLMVSGFNFQSSSTRANESCKKA